MKIEEAHALFMAQYLGQYVVCPEFETSEKFRLDAITISDININDGKLITIPKYSLVITGDFSGGTCGFNQTDYYQIDKSCLLLRSLQDLTDEEYVNLCELILCDWIEKVNVNRLEYGKRIALEIKNDIGLGGQTWTTAWKAIDYLRAIGILLPFTYLSDDNKPVTPSPATLISMGWARVK